MEGEGEDVALLRQYKFELEENSHLHFKMYFLLL